MTHWELEACIEAYKIANNIKAKIAAPTDDEFDEWKANNADKKSKAAQA